jgi:hypothetical protein
MHWLYLVVSGVLLLVSNMRVTPFWLGVLLVLASGVLFVVFILSWMGSRLSGASRDEVKMISPEEMRLMREQAAARKAALEAEKAAPKPDEPAG